MRFSIFWIAGLTLGVLVPAAHAAESGMIPAYQVDARILESSRILWSPPSDPSAHGNEAKNWAFLYKSDAISKFSDVSFKDVTFFLNEDGEAQWRTGPTQLQVLSAPSVMVVEDNEATISIQGEPEQWLEPAGPAEPSVFKLVTSADTEENDALRTGISLRASVHDPKPDSVSLKLDVAVRTIAAREELQGVTLPVGKPKLNDQKLMTTVRIPKDTWAICVLPPGEHTSTLVLLRVREAFIGLNKRQREQLELE